MLKSVSFSGILVCERKSQQKDHVAKHRHSILLERFCRTNFEVVHCDYLKVVKTDYMNVFHFVGTILSKVS